MTTEGSCSLIINKDIIFGTDLGGNSKGSGKGDRGTGIKVDEIRKKLETGTIDQKIDAMKQIVVATVNGERYPQLLMTIIRFAMPENNHYLKKLLFAYWECVEKVDPKTNKLRPEMILVCNLLLRDITHPNEYICGTTLRLLTRIRDGELVESLVPAVCDALQHRHAYVRRNAIWALCTIHQNWPHMAPNAADLVLTLLETETDATCIRNALMMLHRCAPERAAAYINSSLDRLLSPTQGSGSEPVQLIVVNILYRACKLGCTQSERARYIAAVAELLGGSSSQGCSGAVKMEAAGTLLALSNAPSSVKSAALAYVDLLVNESDNNVKLVALGRIADIARRYTYIMQDVVMDLLRALACPVLDVRRRTLAVALDLVAEKNVAEVVAYLKRELARSLTAPAYRQLVVQAIHQCAVRFPVVAADVVHVLMDYIQDPDVSSVSPSSSSSSSYDVIAFVREAVEKYPALRPGIIAKLAESLGKIRSSKVFRAALWVLGEYAESQKDLAAAFAALCDSLRDIPNVIAEREDAEAAAAAAAAAKQQAEAEKEKEGNPDNGSESASAAPKKTNVRVLADGTYASQAAVMEQLDSADGTAGRGSAADGGGEDGSSSSTGKAMTISAEARKRSPLLGQLMDGDHFLAAVTAYTIAKLAIKLVDTHKKDEHSNTTNKTTAEAILALAQLLRLGTSRVVPRTMDTDSRSRIVLCINALADPAHPARPLIVSAANKRAFVALLAEQDSAQKRAGLASASASFATTTTSKTSSQQLEQQKKRPNERQSDDLIRIRQLTVKTKTTMGSNGDDGCGEDGGENDDSYEGGEGGVGDVTDDVIALAKLDEGEDRHSASARLKRVVQLTGFGDPLYAEAFVYVHQYDIVLDVIVTNQTNVTLQDVTLELSTLGDLRLFERPAPVTIAPGVTSRVRAGLKVSSTETGTIFGNLIFELSGQSVTQVTADRNCVPLNEIRIDIIDYIRPATCTDIKFRQMWAEFEWENKIAVAAAPFPAAAEYLAHIVEITNMNCLTPQSALAGDCNFLSANLYARSVFGEDALINVSVEAANGKVSGFVRIRSKTQGIALSLGDKIVQYQSKKDKKKN